MSTWDRLAENCKNYLTKGRKVCCVGPVSASTYQAQDGSTRVSLELTAHEAEFLSSRDDAGAGSGAPQATGAGATAQAPAPQQAAPAAPAFTQVDMGDELPF